jgi:hypothetical protein
MSNHLSFVQKPPHRPTIPTLQRLLPPDTTPHAGRTGATAGTVLGGVVAAIALLLAVGTRAEAAPLAQSCSAEAVQGLARVGGWAVAQCTSEPTLAVVSLSMERGSGPASQSDAGCTRATLEGLARVGGWAAAACESVPQVH